MIKRLKIQNFKSIRAAEIGLERFTVFVGPNASGKTSILEAVHRLALLRDPSHRNTLPPATYTRNAQGALQVVAEGVWGHKAGTLDLSMGDAGLASNGFTATSHWNPRLSTSTPSVMQFDTAPSSEAEHFWNSVVLLRLEPRVLAEPSFSLSDNPRIDSTGSGMASALAQLALSRPKDFSDLVTALRAVVPQVQRVRLSLAQVKREEVEMLSIEGMSLPRRMERTYTGHRIIFDMMSADDLPSESASEGTLLALGFLTVLLSPSRPSLLLVDDLDRGLHPTAQRELIAQLRQILERFPELQILATSHSPYLLDCMKPEEVRLTAVSADGSTACAPLASHPDFQRWKDMMLPGEFWSTVGEGWVKARDSSVHG